MLGVYIKDNERLGVIVEISETQSPIIKLIKAKSKVDVGLDPNSRNDVILMDIPTDGILTAGW
jgi:hypothetical protein